MIKLNVRIKNTIIMDKETITNKTTWEKTKESFIQALMPAGIVLAVLLLLWIPFKVIPAIYNNGSKFVATSLSSLLVSEEASSTELINQNNQPVNTNPTSNAGATYATVKIPKVYYGKPDLEISLVSTGIIDPVSKQYVQTNYAGFNDEIAIRFEVKNIGTNVSGAWKLRINTPSRTTPYYDSADQTSIKPGDKIIFTTSFDSPLNTGVNTTYITADPLNMVDESSESNNSLTVPVKVEGTYYSYNNNYNYGAVSVAPNLPYGNSYTWTSMKVNCYANTQVARVGYPITWYATASGGNGYYSYAWVGSDQLYANENAVNKTYYYSGNKAAYVTVTSNGQSITKQCNVDVTY